MNNKISEYVTTYNFLGDISVYSFLGEVILEDAKAAYKTKLDKVTGDYFEKIEQLKSNERWPEIIEGMTHEEIDKAYFDRVGVHLDKYLKLELMTYEEFLVKQAKEFADKPINIISKQEWWDALECLPPLKWHDRGGMEVFFMSEFYTGNYTSMYVKVVIGGEDTYACKTVNFKDESTWITEDEVCIQNNNL